MNLSLTARRPNFTHGIAGILSPALERLGFLSIARSRAVPEMHEAAGETDVDPHQLSRAGLLAELLAPAPYLAAGEPGVVVDRNPIPLSAVAEAAVARKLSVARELICRDLLAEMRNKPVFDRPDLLAEWLRLQCAGIDYEVFLVLYFDAQNRLITIEQLCRGTLTQTSVYPREVLKEALKRGAAAVAFAHNHPSGSLEPSAADQCLTRNLKSALSLVDVHVLDHFIIAGAQYYSFAEHGLI